MLELLSLRSDKENGLFLPEDFQRRNHTKGDFQRAGLASRQGPSRRQERPFVQLRRDGLGQNLQHDRQPK